MMGATTRVEPALYCGTYAKYNDGSIAGKWLKLSDYDGPEAFLAACRDLHRDESDPEFMFQDYEGFPKSLYGESLSISDLEGIYEWVALSDEDQDLVAEYLDATGCDAADVAIQDVRDSLFCVLDPGWSGVNAAMGNYLLDEGLIDVPEHLQGYIDVEALGRDWLMDLSVSPSGYVFEA